MRRLLALFFIITFNNNHIASPPPVHLKTIAQLDSLGMNAQGISLMKKFQLELVDILLGIKTIHGREGLFIYKNKKHSLQELLHLESGNGIVKSDLKMVHTQIKDHFEKISKPFQDLLHGPGIKSIMSTIIQDWCEKRSRVGSLLLIWTRNTGKNEYELFDTHVQTIQEFATFFTDLHLFLEDLVLNCPKAFDQYKDQVTKFSLAKPLVNNLDAPPEMKKKFLQHLSSHLIAISKNDISQPKIQQLYTDFKDQLLRH